MYGNASSPFAASENRKNSQNSSCTTLSSCKPIKVLSRLVQYLIIKAMKPDVWNYSFLFSFPGTWMLVVQAVFLHTSIWGESSCHM